MADTTDPEIDKCKTCDKPAADGQTLKRCGRCRIALYCSLDCQQIDWKLYKASCDRQAQSNAESNSDTTSGTRSDASQGTDTPRASDALEMDVERPFHKIHATTWLHGQPFKDVYKLLIDTYHLHVEDDYLFLREDDWDSLYSGVHHGVKLGFWRFLGFVHDKMELLPVWWSLTHAYECLMLGASGAEWNNLDCAVNKLDISDHYKDHLVAMQLRMFAEQISGPGPGEQSGDKMLQVQMWAENDEYLLEY